MTQVRLSISIDQKVAEYARKRAKAKGITVSSVFEDLMDKAMHRDELVRAVFEEWDDENARIDAEAAKLTYEELWADMPELPVDEKRELEAQLDRADALGKARRRR